MLQLAWPYDRYGVSGMSELHEGTTAQWRMSLMPDDERTQQIFEQVQVLMAQHREMAETLAVLQAHTTRVLHILDANGTPGLATRTALLESRLATAETWVTRMLLAAGTAVVGLIGGGLAFLVRGLFEHVWSRTS